jgi:hypothetical protein
MWAVVLLVTAAALWFTAIVCDARGYRYTAALFALAGAVAFAAMLLTVTTAPRAPRPVPVPVPLPSHGPSCVDIAWLDDSWKCVPADQAG